MRASSFVVLLLSLAGCIEAGGGRVIERGPRPDDKIADSGPGGSRNDRDVPRDFDAGAWVIPDGASTPRADVVVPSYDRTCASIHVAAMPTTPNVMIVLDRSGSMYDDDSGVLIDRWTPAVRAVDEVTHALASRVRFGLMLFGSDEECAVGTIRVGPDLGTADTIMGQLSGDPEALTGGGTPTAASLDVARSVLTSMPERSYVLLVTDGAPNCNSSLSGTDCRCTAGDCQYNNLNCLDAERAVQSVVQLNEGGVSTFVIGYGTADWSDVLDRMAVAGNTGRAAHIRVDDGAELQSALREVSRSVISCTYNLEMPVEDVRYIRVEVDGVALQHVSQRSDGAGWALPNRNTVELVGASCAAIQDGEHHEVNITIECEPQLI